MGRSMQAEYEGAMRVMDNAEKPLVLVLGGFKPDDCYRVAKHFLENGIADKLVCGGVFGNECLMTQGISLGEAQEKQYADNNFLYVMDGLGELVKKHSQKLVLPVDLAFEENGSRKEARVSALPRDKLFLDLGSESIELFCREIKAAKTVYLKGPMGKFEDARFSEGTRRVFETSLDSRAFTAVGGGHTETAFQKLGLDSNRISFKSLSGGAFVTLLSGGELPALNALVESRKKFGK
jgi:phosphoglycerate kinase